MNKETKVCQNCRQGFTIESEDFNFYKKIDVPPPTFCPQCRLIRRLSFRNERYLYKRKCGLCEKEMVSILAPEKKFTAFCPEDWWSDKWDATSYGTEYDFSKSFFDQYRDLLRRTPWVSLQSVYSTMVNSEYSNMCGSSKNCYLTTHADHNEDCAYASGLKYCRDSLDLTMVQSSELSYECVNVINGNRNLFSLDCKDCHDIYFSKNLSGCNNCVGCVNLKNKSYCIFNEQYPKEEYEKKIKGLNLHTREGLAVLKQRAEKFWLQYPQKFYHGTNNVNTSGDYIYNSKNTLLSYEMMGAEDCKYCHFLSTKPSRDCWDYTEWGEGATLMYECLVSGLTSERLKFCWVVMSSHDIEYSMHCSSSSNLFGCFGLRNKEYCILNKQYSKVEYEALIPKIREQMKKVIYKDAQGRSYGYGEFFPSELSPYAYNETAQDFFVLSREEALSQGFAWRDPETKSHPITIEANELPSQIDVVNDSILKEIIGCMHKGACDEQCAGAFRIIPQELQSYRRLNLPIPQLCPNCRHAQRIKWRNPLIFSERTCQCSGKTSVHATYLNRFEHSHGSEPCQSEFVTSYAPERPEIVYCESCYQQEVA